MQRRLMEVEMELLTEKEMVAVAGGLEEIPDLPPQEGGGGGGGSGSIPVVVITGSFADSAQARADYASYNEMSAFISAAAGFGAAAVSTGVCTLVPTLLSGPAAPETAALLSRPCTFLGTTIGMFTGIYVGGLLKGGIRFLDN